MDVSGDPNSAGNDRQDLNDSSVSGTAESAEITQKRRNRRLGGRACKILEQHHRMLQNDPDRLETQYLIDLIHKERSETGPDERFSTIKSFRDTVISILGCDSREIPASALLVDFGSLSDSDRRRIVSSCLVDDDMQAYEFLLAVLSSKPLKVQAASILGMDYSERAANVLIEIYGDPDTCEIIIDSFRRKGRTGCSQLIACARKGTSAVRWNCMMVLGKMSIPAVKPLIRCLKDSDFRIRHIAANALGELGNPFALPALERAQDDDDPLVRARARESINILKHVESVKPAPSNDAQPQVTRANPPLRRTIRTGSRESSIKNGNELGTPNGQSHSTVDPGQRLLQWSRENAFHIRWGSVQRNAWFSPVFLIDHVFAFAPFTVFPDDRVAVPISEIRRWPPFTKKEKGERLFDRLRGIPGIEITGAQSCRHFVLPLRVLSASGSCAMFIDIVEWIVAEIETHST